MPESKQDSGAKIDIAELYKITVEEEHRELETHHKRVSFFASMISALVVATFVGVRFAEQWFELFILSALPALIIALCYVGEGVSKQFYERFLAAVTMRAKIEQYLGLTAERHLEYPSNSPTITYWLEEPFVPVRNLQSRSEGFDYLESINWSKDRLFGGYHGSAKKLFDWIRYAALGLVVILLLLSLLKLIELI